MKNLKVRTKLIVAFAIVIVLALAVGLLGILNLYRLDADYTYAITSHGKPLTEGGTMIADLHAVRAELRAAMIFSGDAERVQNQRNLVNNFLTDFETNAEIYDATIISEASRALYDEAMSVYQSDFLPAVETVLANADDGVPSAELAAYMVSDIKPAIDLVLANLQQCLANKSTNLDTTSAEGTALFNQSFIILTVLLVATVAISVVMALYISALISRPLVPITAFMRRAGATGDLVLDEATAREIATLSRRKDELGELISMASAFVAHVTEVSDTLETISGGDLTAEIKILGDKDTLGLSLRKMSDSLNRVFGEFGASSTQVSTGANQVADGSQALAQGATQQAASIQELSSAITEIAEKTKANAQLAEQSARLSNTIMSSAEKGSRQMDEMTVAVKDINEASHSIGKVIKTIDDIAFQTNILALNAAVEAARAGEHGKGFAVVADEVRNLAAKSAEAAKDTESLIANSIAKAELGERIAGETATSLTEIVSGINESSALVAEIATSSEAQSAGIGEINIGIDQVAQVVQQNSATAEESAAAAEEMSSQTTLLQELVAQFKIKGADGRALPPASRASLKSPAITQGAARRNTEGGGAIIF